MVRLAVLCWAVWSWCGVVVAVSVISGINVVCKEECAGLDGALSFTYYGKGILILAAPVTGYCT